MEKDFLGSVERNGHSLPGDFGRLRPVRQICDQRGPVGGVGMPARRAAGRTLGVVVQHTAETASHGARAVSQGPPLSVGTEGGAFRRGPRTPEERGRAGPDQRVNSVNFVKRQVNQRPEGGTMREREK